MRERDKTAGELLAEQEARRAAADHPDTPARQYAKEHGVTLAHATQVLAAQERREKEGVEHVVVEGDVKITTKLSLQDGTLEEVDG